MLHSSIQESRISMKQYTRKIPFTFILIIAFAFVLLLPVSNTFAATSATITVTTNLDEFDRTGTGQGCSLREAIQAAEDDQAFGGCPKGTGDDTILLQATTYQITREFDPYGDSGSFWFATNATLQGALVGTTILDGGGSAIKDPVITIGIGYKLTINKLVIQNGASDYHGGGILIDPEADVTINNSTIRNNRTSSTGGGIYNQGTLKLNNTIVRNNYAPGPGGGIANVTYEDYPSATARLKDSEVNDNDSESQGGGIFNHDGTLTLINTTLNKNSAGANGGGIWNNSVAVLRYSTISNNSAHAGGGGIETSEFLTVVNSTISGNRARYNGGGVSNYGAAEFYSSTIASNVADADWDNSNDGGGGIYSTNQTAVVRNTIIADNRNLDSLLTEHKDDCKGDLQLEYYSLLESVDNCTLHITQTNNILYQDPKLEPLTNNGGSTKTHALKSNSPAIDEGHPNGCQDTNASNLTADQRGYVRVVNGDTLGNPRCDMGAFEYNSFPLPIVTVTPPTVAPTQTPSPTATKTASPTATNTPPNGQCNAKPNAPTLQSPANGAIVTTPKVKLDWADVNCAAKYKVRVRIDSKQGIVLVRKTLTLTQYKTQALETGHTYFGKLLACNTHGCNATKFKFSVQ